MRKIFQWLFGKKKPIWIYGTCRDRTSRKHRVKGNVQFVIWKAGEHGREEDYWIDFDSFWRGGFVANTDKTQRTER